MLSTIKKRKFLEPYFEYGEIGYSGKTEKVIIIPFFFIVKSKQFICRKETNPYKNQYGFYTIGFNKHNYSFSFSFLFFKKIYRKIKIKW